MAHQETMVDYIHKQMPLFLEDLEKVVNIDSASGNTLGLSQVAQFFKNRFKALNMTSVIHQLGSAKIPCLESRTCCDKGSEKFDVMLLGHMDTVFPIGEVEKRPFSIVSEDKAMGPGVADMKAGLVTILHVLETLNHFGLKDHLSICVAFNGDEETGSEASREWIEMLASQSKRVFVFEACRPGYGFVLNRNGGGWFHITCHGKAAHAGVEPKAGANAIVELAHQVLEIEHLNSSQPDAQLNVTVIRGGEKINIIPARAEAKVDVRVANDNAARQIESYFANLQSRRFLPNVTVQVDGHISRPPMNFNHKTHDLWELIQTAARDIDLTIKGIETAGSSDGNFTSALGVPTIDGMGPIGGSDHSPDEYIDLTSVAPIIHLVSEVCRQMADRRIEE
ncbi:MAG: M20 family metallopeptidase [Desulfobacteraceae bacterium]|nr:M20 family metallopeptidase [Desulfobacteraceae bacterium]